MGLKAWIERKMELSKQKNEAEADALKEYYKSDEYKKDIVRKHKEGKGSDFQSWLKRVSKNAASSMGDETVKIDTDKLLGKKK